MCSIRNNRKDLRLDTKHVSSQSPAASGAHPGRRSVLGVAVGLAGAALVQPAWAQAEGTEFRQVRPEVPTDTPGKIEVIEFFWYGCPHCNALEPFVREWSAKLPPDVAFRKVHVNFQEVKHQQLFCTLEAMGKSAELNDRIFHAIHVERNRLDSVDKIADFIAKQGVDRKQFVDTFSSFSVQTRMRKATSLQEAYKVDGVPAIGINGRFYTAPSMAGGNPNALKVADVLIDRERKARK